MEPQEKENRLAKAASAYLRSAGHQPVDWHEWSEEAFARARAEDKPILLDIGAVWCHWCHVMDRESYEDPEVAAIINQHFLPIKVDRDERPDIDARLQTAISAISGAGGWPLTAFLTPDGKPFFGGTYFPPEDYFGRPGLKRVLLTVAQNYRSHKTEIFSSADKLVEAVGKAETFEGARRPFSPSLVDSIIDSIVRMFDLRHGGFGNAPKFPHPAAIDLLLDRYQSTREPYLLTVVTTTLEKMAGGGVYDQLAGGFHRYSVDERWCVPHFEKMSYDNSGLLENYLHGYQVTRNSFFREIAEGIIAWVDGTLSDRELGGFYASQDADYSLEDDGDYFTWTLDELRAVLSEDDARWMALHYDIEPHGEMHHNPAKNVLWVAKQPQGLAEELGVNVAEVNERITRAKKVMLEARSKRSTPYVDRTLYTGWNGLLISAYLEAWRVLGRAGCRDFALKTAERFLAVFDNDRGMPHRLSEDGGMTAGVLDDHVFFANALLDAFEVTLDRRYFDRARRLMDMLLAKYWDNEEGGFFDRAVDAPALEGVDVRRKPYQDSPTPAGNPAAAIVLNRMYGLTLNPDYHRRAQLVLDGFAGLASQYGLFAATYGLAGTLHTRHVTQVLIVGERDDQRTRALGRAAHEFHRFGKLVLEYEPRAIETANLPEGLSSTLAQIAPDSAPRAFVCIETTCYPPAATPDELAKLLAGTGAQAAR